MRATGEETSTQPNARLSYRVQLLGVSFLVFLLFLQRNFALNPSDLGEIILQGEDSGQSHLQAESQSHLQAESQSHLQAQSQSHLQAQSQSHLQAQSQSHLQAQSQSHLQAQSQSHLAELQSPPPHTRANATFLTLCRNEELFPMLETIQNFQDRFNNRYNYDWVFLNDVDFTDVFKEQVSNLVTGQLKFGTVSKEHWSVPESVDGQEMILRMSQLSKEKEFDDVIGLDIPYANSTSYRNMCRWQSGFFYKHELLQPYKYYWRVEPHVKLYCDIEYDVFHTMQSQDLQYGFTISIFEFRKTIPNLFRTVKEYLSKHGLSHLLTSKDNLSGFVYDEDTDDYTLCHFWSNFEIASLDFFRSPQYESYFQYLDQTNGFYYERWGDLPVHSILASLFLPKDKVKWFHDIGYYHPPYLQCPREKDTFKKGKCSCDPNHDFTFNLYSCTRFFLETMDSDVEVYEKS